MTPTADDKSNDPQPLVGAGEEWTNSKAIGDSEDEDDRKYRKSKKDNSWKEPERREEELSEFEKNLDTEKYGYTPSLFHVALPITAFVYHY